MRKLTINEMAEKQIENGLVNWFEEGAMNFFNTVIETQPNKMNIFITSERMELDMPKRYSLRWFNHTTNKVETLGEFQQFSDIEDAKQFRKTFTGLKEIEQMGIELGIN